MTSSTARGAAPCVERIAVRHVANDLPRPFRSGIHAVRTMHNVVVSIEAGGETGSGYTFAFAEHEARAVAELVHGLAAPLPGEAVEPVDEHWRRMWAATNFIGHGGAGTMALSAIDTALWNLRARLHGTSLAGLLGAAPEPRPVYASGGSLDLDTDELVAEALARRSEGYGGYKTRVGLPEPQADVERVAALREALGDFPLMVDANQGWDRSTAARAIEALAAFDLAWLEEPLDAEDVSGLAWLRALGAVPIAAGESVYGSGGARALLEAEAVDVLQPDLMRSGGVTGMVAVGALAAEHGVPVSPHLFAETAPQLMAAMPGATSVECFPGWFDHLFGPPAVREGEIVPDGAAPLAAALEHPLAGFDLERVAS